MTDPAQTALGMDLFNRGEFAAAADCFQGILRNAGEDPSVRCISARGYRRDDLYGNAVWMKR